MGIVVLVALGILVGVLVVNAPPANPQPLPPQPETTTTTQQPDCGCGVPASPRGPR